MPSIQDCLNELGCDSALMQTCQTLAEEWSLVRKAYFKRVLKTHPDKGGDVSTFRKVQAAWETLRQIHKDGRTDFFSATTAANEHAAGYETKFENFDGTTAPSWEFYYSAAEENQPINIIELAKSGRSSCANTSKNPKLFKCVPTAAKDEASSRDPGEDGMSALVQKYPMNAAGKYLIAKGEIRVGTLNKVSGTYTWFRHLRCWRVPSKVWLGLPNPKNTSDASLFLKALASMNAILFTGFDELDFDHQMEVVRHVMDTSHWAKLTKRKKKTMDTTALEEYSGGGASSSSSNSSSSSSSFSEKAVTAAGASSSSLSMRKVFVMPRPGVDGAKQHALEGKTVVLTGVFPEVGGGAGLNLGKSKVKAMLQSFSARVTSAVSGKTDILVVGKAPGMSKVSKARRSAKCRLVSLEDLKLGLEADAIEDLGQKKMLIKNFSKGFGYSASRMNGLADKASHEDLAIAQGLKPAPVVIKNKRKKRTRAKNTKTKTKVAAKKAARDHSAGKGSSSNTKITTAMLERFYTSIGDLDKLKTAKALVKDLEDTVLKSALSEKYGEKWAVFFEQECSTKANGKRKAKPPSKPPSKRRRTGETVVTNTEASKTKMARQSLRKRRGSPASVSSTALVNVTKLPKRRTRAERAAARAASRGF